MLDPFAPDGFAANFNWDDEIFAELMAAARRQNEPGARGQLYLAAMARIHDQMAVIPLLHERAHWLVGERVIGTRRDIQPMLWRDLELIDG